MNTRHVVRFIGIVAVFWLAIYGLGAALTAVGTDGDAWAGLAIFVLFAVAARRVAYRVRDVAIILVPGVGWILFMVWLFKFAWRFAALPERYWSDRPVRIGATPVANEEP